MIEITSLRRSSLLTICVCLFGFALSRDAAAQPTQNPGPSAKPNNRRPVTADDYEAMARVLENAYRDAAPPESVRMLMAIARGSQMGPGDGWFGPAQSRYTWEWLANLHGVSPSGAIELEGFKGDIQWFQKLDRDQNGAINAADLDWSDRNPFVQQSNFVTRWFRKLDSEANGKLTKEELIAFFEKASHGKDYVNGDDLRDAVLANPPSLSAFDSPKPDTLIRGLFRGEIGSLQEGPAVDAPAPDFRLKSEDGLMKVRLSGVIGEKPVVLVFGNFTCGPYRSSYPAVDEICVRYGQQAVFLHIYVREAHPTDGWHMESNAKQGVKLPQPTTYEERVGVALQCRQTLKHSMPLLVDEINDPVGTTYSGMPARLYVIDSQGKVAFKSGRGPFGFKSGEMEQALVMALLESKVNAAREAVTQAAQKDSNAKLDLGAPTLESAREPLESTREPLESAREPLESTREPLESTREPLESTREPLESAKERIESAKERFESTKESLEAERKRFEADMEWIKSATERIKRIRWFRYRKDALAE